MVRVEVAWGDDLDLVEPEDDEPCVVIDVLRASTTMAVMLSRGVKGIRTCTSVEETIALRDGVPDAIACGEREGYPPEGFDLGNSPVEMLGAPLEGKIAFLTTTNFTRITGEATRKGFKHVLSCAMVNRHAVASYLSKLVKEEGMEKILLVPAGRKDKAYEDLAGSILLLKRLKQGIHELDLFLKGMSREERFILDEIDNFPGEPGKPGEIFDHVVPRSRHARYLLQQGGRFVEDVKFSLQLDVTWQVPVLEPKTGMFVPALG